MPALAIFFLAATLTFPVSTLVLRSGERLTVEGDVREQDGRVIFRADGNLYSLALAEVDVEATRTASQPDRTPSAGAPKKLKVSEEERKRLIAELERNHGGVPAPAEQRTLPPTAPKSRNETERERNAEWAWRERARNYEESVRRARENLSLLEQRVEQLRGEISGLLSLGYKPGQFSYQTSQLHNTLDQIPYAQLDVTRAERAWDQFREDARKQGVMPGWLR